MSLELSRVSIILIVTVIVVMVFPIGCIHVGKSEFSQPKIGKEVEPPSPVAFLYIHYLGEQAKPFPVLILTTSQGRETTNFQQLLNRYSLVARHYVVPNQKFAEIWQLLLKEYVGQSPPIFPPVGDNLFEIVLWNEVPQQILLDRQKTRLLLRQILALDGAFNSHLLDEINTLIRRLSN